MRFVGAVFIALSASLSMTAMAECHTSQLREPLRLTDKALELRSTIFMFLCAKSTSTLVDGDDASIQDRIARPQFANADKVGPADFYPANARRQGLEGLVVHLLVVEADGKISQYARIDSSGIDVLDQAALMFLSAVRMTPGTFDGVPTRMVMVLPIRFKLPDGRR